MMPENEKIGSDTYSQSIASAYRYMDWMLSPFRDYLHGDIVEIGIGHGSYYEAIVPLGKYLGIDIDERAIARAKGRFPNGNFAQADICHHGFLDRLLPTKADSIISINVLEHISDDATAISNLVDAIKSGGRLMISVPAMGFLYNDLDRLAGHHRRYTIDYLRSRMSRLPVDIERLCYFNPLGGLGWWANRLRRHASLNSDEVNGQIEIFEKYVLPVSRLLDPLTRGFFGQSLICIARRI